ncbi:MAG: response regulator [Gammaproteobacteria bacterium]|nr:response regulator [Gammaproteobacteria bacterium]
MSNNRELNILLVEDDDVACEAIIRSFAKHNIPFPLIIAHDGLEALQILRDQNPKEKIEDPLIILLDLNMPRMNGFEFLQELRADSNLSSLVVFVLTTSNDDSDRTRAYAEQIAGYMVKSMVGPHFRKLADLLLSYRQTISFPQQQKAS